jgi:hypothetical protein
MRASMLNERAIPSNWLSERAKLDEHARSFIEHPASDGPVDGVREVVGIVHSERIGQSYNTSPRISRKQAQAYIQGVRVKAQSKIRLIRKPNQ